MQYQIFVQNPSEKRFTASVVGIPACVAEGKTKEEALASVQLVLEEQLAHGEFVTLDLASTSVNGQSPPTNGHSPATHTWMKFAGTWANDPDFDEFVAEMQRERELEDQA
jgi:predicted RNase H-like HicB family nuclease